MLKLIITDDERATREKILENIKWDKLNIEVTGEAKDGIEGLELVKDLHPDIVLMDVRMPKMNGIECANEIRKIDKECKIIFLSGFTDKEYLKSAIQLKAIDYIEKPIDLDELSAVLKKTVLLCNEENLKKIREDELNNKISQNVLLIKQELALEMIRRNADITNLKKQFDNIKENVPISGNFLCILFKLNIHKISDIDCNMILHKEKVLKIICKEFEGISGSYVTGILDGSHIVIHVYGKAVESTIILKEAIKRIQVEFDQMYHTDGALTAGAGVVVRGMENIYKSYHNAQKALQKSFFTGYNSIIFLNGDMHTKVDISADDINRKLKGFFDGGNYKAAEMVIDELIKGIKMNFNNLNVHTIKGIFLSIMLNIAYMARDSGLSIGKEWKDKELHWAELLNNYTIDDISEFILDKLKIIFTQAQEQIGLSKKIRTVIEFIKEHYSEDISVVIIADHLNMRSTYLSTLFKKETGKTLCEYIEAVRMKKARELLNDDRLKMNELAHKVGYNNANYFTSVFKKVVGVYPSDFRRSNVK